MKKEQIKTSETLKGDDLITTLPDHVLCHILSFLPIDNEALTSLLSKRWMHLFDSVLDIDLSDDSFQGRRGSPSVLLNFDELRSIMSNRFKVFVDKVLLARNSAGINKFRLACRWDYDYSTISRWISGVVSLNVRKLDIIVMMEESCIVPHEIFTCRSLESLKLCLGEKCVLSVPGPVILPNLKALDLIYVTFVGDDSIKRLFSCCPALEELKIVLPNMEYLETFEISVPSLKYLCFLYHCVHEGGLHVVLDTPNLQHLVCSPCDSLIFLTKNMKSLVSANISCRKLEKSDVRRMVGESISMLINENNLLKSLSMLGHSLTVLYCSPCSLAKFQNSYMELNSTDTTGYLMLPALLECCPNLEVLSFPEGFICVGRYDLVRDIEYSLPESVPPCLSRSLKEIRIGDFYGRECEFELAEYFLQNGGGLTKMMIGDEVRRNLLKYYNLEWVSPTCDRLSKASRGSAACQVVISWFEEPGDVRLCRKIL